MRRYFLIGALLSLCFFSLLKGEEKALPDKILKIMQQPKYEHAIWGIYAKEVESGKTLIDLNSNQLFLPGSVSKLFSVAALLHAFGDNYRFKTPVYMRGTLQNGILEGDLIIIGQGDLTMGGRQKGADAIEFTKMDHIYANDIPGALLTKEDPLKGFQGLADQIWKKEVRQIEGNILVDDTLFEKTEKRGMILTPLMVNENLIDIVISPTQAGMLANLSWRPQVDGYTVTNKVKTVDFGQTSQIQINSDSEGRTIFVEGTVAADQKDLLRIFSIKDPIHFAKAAFIECLKRRGISFKEKDAKNIDLPNNAYYQSQEPIALWTSPSLIEYAKLILKVSHNLGADLIPLLLGAKKGEKTFEKGMAFLGQFIEKEVSLSRNEFVFSDAAGGDSNRLTPVATVKLLSYLRRLSPHQFQNFYKALPILGVDGSLADVAKTNDAAGQVFAKTGTGVSFNLATGNFFLTTQALAGYVIYQNRPRVDFTIVVNNAEMPEIKDIFPIFEEQGQIAGVLFDLTR